MGSKLNFVFSTCPPHFCCMFTILADVRKNRLLYVGKCWKFCKNPPCFPTHILWIKIFLTMDFDFLRYRGLQGTHMDAWKPSGIFWTKFVDLQQCAPAWVRLAVWPARPQSKEIWLKGECATLPVVCKPKVSMMLNSSPRLLYWPKQRHIQFYLVLLLRSYLFLTIEVKPPPSNCLLSITFGLAWLKLMVTSLITCMYHLLT